MESSLTNEHLRISIKHKGAELCSIKNVENQEFIWQANPDFWGRHAPILFPFVGGLKEGKYTHNSKEYKMSQHGFARDCDFNLIEKTTDSICFSLQSNYTTLAQYPFHFKLSTNYHLQKNVLHIRHEVYNQNSDTMYFSIGAHPAFALHDHISQYSIKFENNETLSCHTLEQGLISDTIYPVPLVKKSLQLSYDLFEKDALIFKNIHSKSVTLYYKEQKKIKIDYQHFPDLGIWTKKNAPFLCIEPWFGYADTIFHNGILEQKEGILSLPPYETFSTEYQITLF